MPFPMSYSSLPPGMAEFRERADALILPPSCTVNIRTLPRCIRTLRPTDPPVVVLMNKIFDFLPEKVKLVAALQSRLALLTMPTPHAAALARSVEAPVRFWPYGASLAFGPRVNSTRPYKYDIGFTGSVNRYSKRCAPPGHPSMCVAVAASSFAALTSAALVPARSRARFFCTALPVLGPACCC